DLRIARGRPVRQRGRARRLGQPERASGHARHVRDALAPRGRRMTAVALRGFFGEVIAPSDEEYDAARSVFNGMIDRRPDLIARCADPADIAPALRYALAAGGPVAIRAGGHSVAGHSMCEGGTVIDLSRLRGVEVDAERRVARVQPGATWKDFDKATGE